MTILNAKNIEMNRQGSIHLAFPDLAIARNDRVLLLGSSGCGKTTLLSVLAGILKPTKGVVTLLGHDMYALSRNDRDKLRSRNFGFVFQTLHLLPSLNLRQNVALASDMANISPDGTRLDELLDTLGLSEKAHRRPDALSQGEQQRAAIARAVLNKPAIIVADEPTSALDNANAKIVMDLIEFHARQTGAALLVATHDERIVHRFSTIIHLDQSMTAKAAA